jgi:hypothetical protein
LTLIGSFVHVIDYLGLGHRRRREWVGEREDHHAQLRAVDLVALLGHGWQPEAIAQLRGAAMTEPAIIVVQPVDPDLDGLG